MNKVVMETSDFGQTLKHTISPAKCREKLIGSDLLSDVTFLLGKDNEELKAHRMFLLTVSPIFHSIFSDPLLIDEETSLQVKISDISRATMIEICKFAYCDNPRIDMSNMIDLMKASSKLQIKGLLEKTVEFIKKEGLNDQTVFHVLESNLTDKNLVINLKCFAYIEKNHARCLKTKEFLSCPSDVMRLLLQACKLPPNVIENAVIAWSSRAQNEDDEIKALAAAFKEQLLTN